ncbi:MAG TPA: BRO family protein [Nitrosomonas halophila]|nr:BRO family protein [Nitrosomonas halophila]
MTALTLSFQETQFDVVDRNGQHWLRGLQVASALGYADQSSINRIYARNQGEFTDSMTASVKLTDPNGDLQETRIFSLRGCHLLAMFARTKIAKEFRKWVLDILDKEVNQQSASITEQLISPEQEGILFNLMATRFPEGKDRPYGWSRFQRHFVVNSYKNLPASKFAEACLYIPFIPDRKTNTLPSSELTIKPPVWTRPDPVGTKDALRSIQTMRSIIADLQIWCNELPDEAGAHLWNALDDMKKLLITGATEINEALLLMHISSSYLERWVGKGQ